MSNPPETPPTQPTAVSKLGFLGGSFDPIHKAHLAFAQAARTQLGLDTVFFIPAGQAPLKDAVCAGARHRLAMIRAAVAGVPGLDVLDWEIEAGGISYTIDTVRRLRARWPHAKLYWLIGADQVEQLHLWKHIDKLAGLVEFAWADRPGFSGTLPPNLPAALRLVHIDGLSLPEASRDVRDLCQKGEPFEFLLPDCVNRYIKEHKLYHA